MDTRTLGLLALPFISYAALGVIFKIAEHKRLENQQLVHPRHSIHPMSVVRNYEARPLGRRQRAQVAAWRAEYSKAV